MKPFGTLLFAVVALHSHAAELKSVSFFEDTVSDLDGRVVKFLTGSVWLLDHEIVGVPLSKAVIICNGPPRSLRKRK